MRRSSVRTQAVKKPKDLSVPDDMVTDLREAFGLYDRDNSGSISMGNFRNILHNFGFWRVSKKDMEEELRNNDIQLTRKSVKFVEVLNVVKSNWCKGGKETEARDCFRIFDKKDRGTIIMSDLKEVLEAQLEFGASDQELKELLTDLDPQNTGIVTYDAFLKNYEQL